MSLKRYFSRDLSKATSTARTRQRGRRKPPKQLDLDTDTESTSTSSNSSSSSSSFGQTSKSHSVRTAHSEPARRGRRRRRTPSRSRKAGTVPKHKEASERAEHTVLNTTGSSKPFVCKACASNSQFSAPNIERSEHKSHQPGCPNGKRVRTAATVNHQEAPESDAPSPKQRQKTSHKRDNDTSTPATSIQQLIFGVARRIGLELVQKLFHPNRAPPKPKPQPTKTEKKNNSNHHRPETSTEIRHAKSCPAYRHSDEQQQEPQTQSNRHLDIIDRLTSTISEHLTNAV